MQIKNINDYVKQIQEKFPFVSEEDIKRICVYCFKQLYLFNIYGGDVCISDNDFWMYIGNLTNDSLKHFNNYIYKLTTKIRILNKRHKIPWDGYYYFALTENQYLNIKQQENKRGRKRKAFIFENILLYKLYEECNINRGGKKYIYRIPFCSDFGYKKFFKQLKTNKAELIEINNPVNFNDILVTNYKYKYGG